MHRLSLSSYLITILIILALTLGAAQLLQTWLNGVNNKTSGRIERAGQIVYP